MSLSYSTKTPFCLLLLLCVFLRNNGSMYVTLTDIQNGEPVELARDLGGLEVTLCEIIYYHQWYNISAELGNNKVSNRGESDPLEIPNGYYNVCELDKKAFRPLGAELSLNPPTGRLQVTTTKQPLHLNTRLTRFLGFTRANVCQGGFCLLPPNKTYIANQPYRLAVHWEICIHLAEISTSDNLHNGQPSTLLRSVPVENEKCGGGRTETFPVLQYKKTGIWC